MRRVTRPEAVLLPALLLTALSIGLVWLPLARAAGGPPPQERPTPRTFVTPYRSALATIRASYLLGYRPPPAPTAAVAERRWREIGVGLADSRHRHRLVHRAGALR